MKRSNYLIDWTKLDYYITKGVILKDLYEYEGDEPTYEFVLLRAYSNFKGLKGVTVINNKNEILKYDWDKIELYDVVDEQAFDFIVSDEPDTDDVVDDDNNAQQPIEPPTDEDTENSDTPPTEPSGDENADDTPIEEVDEPSNNDENSQDNTNEESDPYSQFE